MFCYHVDSNSILARRPSCFWVGTIPIRNSRPATSWKTPWSGMLASSAVRPKPASRARRTLPSLEADKEAPAMPVRGVGFIPRYTFYVGIDDVAEEVVRPVAGNLPGAAERKSVRRKEPTVRFGAPQEMTAVAKTRRRTAVHGVPAPNPNPSATPTSTGPEPKAKSKRAKTVPVAKSAHCARKDGSTGQTRSKAS